MDNSYFSGNIEKWYSITELKHAKEMYRNRAISAENVQYLELTGDSYLDNQLEMTMINLSGPIQDISTKEPKKHFHPSFEFYYIIKGTINFEIFNRKICLSARNELRDNGNQNNQFVWFRAHVPHSLYLVSKEATLLAFYHDPRGPQAFRDTDSSTFYDPNWHNEEMILTGLGIKIQQAIAKSNLPIEKCAQILDISEQKLIDMRNNHGEFPTNDLLERMEKYFGIFLYDPRHMDGPRQDIYSAKNEDSAVEVKRIEIEDENQQTFLLFDNEINDSYITPFLNIYKPRRNNEVIMSKHSGHEAIYILEGEFDFHFMNRQVCTIEPKKQFEIAQKKSLSLEEFKGQMEKNNIKIPLDPIKKVRPETAIIFNSQYYHGFSAINNNKGKLISILFDDPKTSKYTLK